MTKVVMVGVLAALVVGSGQAQDTAVGRPPASCTGAEYRQLDFWLGDWDVYEVTDSTQIVARNRVTRILDGCVLRELYQQNNGMVGESYSLWDAARGVWHQSWVTNRGTLLLLDGQLDGDRMVLTGPTRCPMAGRRLFEGFGGRKAGTCGRRPIGQPTGGRPGPRCLISCSVRTDQADHKRARSGQSFTPALRYAAKTSGLKQAKTTSSIVVPSRISLSTVPTATSVARSRG